MEISDAGSGEHVSLPVGEFSGQQRNFPLSNRIFCSAKEFSAQQRNFQKLNT